jgi:hypothetical protein
MGGSREALEIRADPERMSRKAVDVVTLSARTSRSSSARQGGEADVLHSTNSRAISRL